MEETAGVQVQDRPPARLLPAGATLRVAVRAALLLPGGGGGGGSGRSGCGCRRPRRCSALHGLRVAAATGADAVRVRALRGTRRTRTDGDQNGPTSNVMNNASYFWSRVLARRVPFQHCRVYIVRVCVCVQAV